MSDSDEEWITVRRRRGARSGVSKQLQKLAIPVVPLAFDALAEPEERPTQDQSKSKKKKKSKKGKAADAEDEDADDARSDAPTSKPAGGAGKAAAATAAKPSTAATAAQQSFFAWLLSRLVAVLVLLGLMRAKGAKKKRKSKASAGVPAPGASAVSKAAPEPPAPAAKPAAAAAAAPAPATGKDKAPAAGKEKAPAAAASSAAASTPVKAISKAADAAAAGSKKVEAAPAAAAAKAAPAPAKTAAVPAAGAADKGTALTVPPSASTVAAAPVKASDVAKTAPEAAPAPPAPAPPPPAPRAPPPPAVKCDADWGRGKFVVQSLPTAHADVVAAVALAGDLAVSAGYDGAVKLWHWPAPGSPGGAVATRPALARTLVGHSGRVEALAAHAASRRLASSGRDSTLKVWDLGGADTKGADARELSSTYVYESVRAVAVDWAGEGGGAAGKALLGARSGTVLLYSLGAGGGGRKVAALRGHEDEVTALGFLGGNLAVSGSRDGTVRLWDLRAVEKGGAATAVLTGLSGRVCSLTPLDEHHLVAGDCSSSLKLWDLRSLPTQTSRSAPPPPPPRRVANAPGFAGDTCPVAGLWHAPRSGVLVSSSIAWWTANKQALEEAPPSAKLPMACLNVSAVGYPSPASASATEGSSDLLLCPYQYTLRLGPGVVTCMAGAADESGMLVGGATGALWALRLVGGGSAAVAAAERAAAAVEAATAAAADGGGEGGGGGGAGEGGCEVTDALVVGAEEFSDDEYEDDEEEEEEEDEE